MKKLLVQIRTWQYGPVLMELGTHKMWWTVQVAAVTSYRGLLIHRVSGMDWPVAGGCESKDMI